MPTACPCCRGAMTVIGHDTSERLDVIPARFRVLVTRRPKLACRACAGVVAQAPAPERLIPGGMPTEATVAQALVSRYADHLPLYRQSQILARQDIEIGRDTLASWVGHAASEIKPVVARLREILLGSARLFADETTLPVLDPGRGRTKRGFAWAIARDDRPWGGAEPPAVVFRYPPGRGREHAEKLLGDYGGILQCDAATQSTRASPPRPRGPLSRSAGPTREGSLSTWRRAGRRRSRRRRCGGSALRHRGGSAGQAAGYEARGAPGKQQSADRGPVRLAGGAAGAPAGARADSGGDPLRAEPSRGSRAVPRRRAHRHRLQRRGARHPPAGLEQKECAVRLRR